MAFGQPDLANLPVAGWEVFEQAHLTNSSLNGTHGFITLFHYTTTFNILLQNNRAMSFIACLKKSDGTSKTSHKCRLIGRECHICILVVNNRSLHCIGCYPTDSNTIKESIRKHIFEIQQLFMTVWGLYSILYFGALYLK